MNYLKRIGRLVAICICAVCVGIIPITAHDSNDWLLFLMC